MKKMFIGLLVLALAAPSAHAHRLVPNDGTHDGPDQALVIGDPSISQVVYHALTGENPQLWLAFEAEEGSGQYVQLGIPVIDGLEEYTPTLLLAVPGGSTPAPPGAPDLPPGYGALILESNPAERERFDEHFTGTASWILLRDTVTLPASGIYFLTAYHPEAVPGKLWVAVGTREVFGLQDMIEFPQVVDEVRTFHEVQDERPPFLTRVMIFVGRFLQAIFGERN